MLVLLKKPKMYRLPPKPMYDYWRQQQWCSSSYSALMQMSEWLLSQMAPEIELAKKRSLLSSHNNTWWTPDSFHMHIWPWQWKWQTIHGSMHSIFAYFLIHVCTFQSESNTWVHKVEIFPEGHNFWKNLPTFLTYVSNIKYFVKEWEIFSKFCDLLTIYEL